MSRLTNRFLIGLLFIAPVHAEILVDGKIDESEWQQARVFTDLKRTQPYTLDAATVATEVRLLTTPAGIAFAFRCAQPAQYARVKPMTPRDRIQNADRVNVMIDFDADGKTGYNFTVSLSNSIEDAVIGSENQFNTDWDADWQHAVQEDAQGWTAEILLPWTIATMRNSDTPTRELAIYFDRVLATLNERSATPTAYFRNPVFLSDFSKVEVTQYRSQILDFFPYVSTRYDLKNNDSEIRAGADLFWKPSGGFQLTATVNPDFGQVESDELVVNFDAIETYYSDKRPFFTENQGIFDLRTPQDGVILYTRRIGAASDDASGRAADIDAALKLNGNVGAVKYGLLMAEEADAAGRRFAAARLLYPFADGSIGTLLTSVDRPALDRRALVNATDWHWQPSDTSRWEGTLLLSQIDSADGTRSDSGAVVRYVTTPSPQWQHDVIATHLGNALDFNDAGYMPRNSYNELFWESTFKRTQLAADSRTAAVTYSANARYRSNDHGDRLQPTSFLTRNAEFRGGGTHLLELRLDGSGYDDQIARGAGKLWLSSRQWIFSEYVSPRRGRWQFTGGVWVLQEGLNGWALQLEPKVSVNLSERVSIDGYVYPRFSRDWLIWLEGDRLASYRRSQWNTGIDLNWFPRPNHELRAKLQWYAVSAYDATAYRIGPRGRLRADGTADDFSVNSLGVQLRYRYEFAPQSELYLVYSRGGFEEREQHADSGAGLFADALSLRDADQFLAKLRYRF